MNDNERTDLQRVIAHQMLFDGYNESDIAIAVAAWLTRRDAARDVGVAAAATRQALEDAADEIEASNVATMIDQLAGGTQYRAGLIDAAGFLRVRARGVSAEHPPTPSELQAGLEVEVGSSAAVIPVSNLGDGEGSSTY